MFEVVPAGGFAVDVELPKGELALVVLPNPPVPVNPLAPVLLAP